MKVIGDDIVTARKQHVCDHCSCAIEPGQIYKRQTQITDNGFEVHKAHVDCDEVALEIWHNGNMSYDEGVNLSDCDLSDDADWICARYPVVAARFGLTGRESTEVST